MFSEKGLIPDLISLLNLLTAFFIAALAAVATFDRPGLDDPLKGEPALLNRLMRNGIRRDFILTHRQFVCYLFGFLSFISIILLFSLFIMRLVGPSAWTTANLTVTFRDSAVSLRPILKAVGLMAFFTAMWQIVITTLLGIYFLTDRLQFMGDQET